MDYHVILSFLTGLTLLLLNADYIVNSKKSKRKLSKTLHYTIYLIGILNIVLPFIYLIMKGF